ncbi:MAG TPA: L,D-transpeptidase family protein, partial [Anaerolineae bacterium]|nr:L,D-transpeptidase family protein [Anaerolineae bacterium]
PFLPPNQSISSLPSAQPQPQEWAYWPQPPKLKPLTSAWHSLALLGLGSALVVALSLTIAVLLALFFRSERIIPGVSVDGVALGGRSKTEAVALLQQRWAQRRINLDAGGTRQTVEPAALGLILDAAATVQLAHQQGRSPATLRELIKNGGRLEVAPIYRYDPLLARQTLETLAPQLEVPVIEAGLRLVAGRVEATPAHAGQSLDVPATLAKLSQNPIQILDQGRLPLVMQPVAPRLTDISGPLAQANQLVANSISIRAYDPIANETIEWQLEAAEWSDWLMLEIKPDDPTQLAWSLKPDKVHTFLTGQAESLGQERYLELDQAIPAITTALKTQSWPAQLRLYHHPRQHTVQPGETLSSIGFDYGLPYPWIEQANPGLDNVLSPGQVITIPSPDALLPLPVVEHKRLIVSLSQQKLWAYENGGLKWEWPVSTGIASSPTAPGVFQVQTHVPNAYAANWNLWMPHFLGIYRPVPTSDFMNGFHGFPTRNGSTLLWTDDLGHRVTYGCILISSENAATLYDWAEAGVVVEIQP